MHSEEKLRYIVDLLFDVVREVQVNKRGIGCNQNRLFKYLNENKYDYGFTVINGVIMGGYYNTDFGVRRDLYKKNEFFSITIDNIRTFISINRRLTSHNIFASGIGSMSMLDIWDSVESDLVIENRSTVIDSIIQY